MLKKTFASLLVMTLLVMLIMPTQTYAAPKWWDRFKDILAADIVGAADGYLQTESIGGAIAGGIKGSVEAGKGVIGSGSGELPVEVDVATLGDLHYEGLDRVFERFQFNARVLSKESWQRIDRTILIFVWEKGLYSEEIDVYLRGMDPTFEEIMRRIKEASTQNEGFPISENFYSNLEKALAVLDREADDPEVLIDEFIQMIGDASVKESDNDVILANIMAATAKKGYDYYKAIAAKADDTTDIIIEDGAAEIIELDIPPKVRGLEIAIDRLDATVGIDPVVMDVAPFIENSRTMVPFRFIGESLGAEIGWNPDEYSVSYVLGENTVKLYIGKSIATVNGKDIPIDENPLIVARIVNARTMVPIRFISEALGFNVSWDAENRSVAIHSNPYFVQNDLSGEMVE